MKVGTDGVLVGAWARVEPWQQRMLDIGTGTGVIALMLAQRSEGWGAMIDAVEIDADSFGQAQENISASPWHDRINLVNSSIQNFELFAVSDSYDHIVSNPPYFINSLLPDTEGRVFARHTQSLSFEELTMCVSSLLNPGGIFTVIIPADSDEVFTANASEAGLFPRRKTFVLSIPEAAPKRLLLEFGKVADAIEESELTIEAGTPKDYTPEYRALTGDFYLKF